jgi:hypothetical protein
MDKIEFMSPPWIDMAKSQIMRILAGENLAAVNYTFCEEFTDPPEHLRRSGEATIGFYIRIDYGRVEIGDHPIDDADLKIVSDYEDALKVARDPNALAADPELMRERVAAGRLKIIGSPLDAPQILKDLNIHMLLAPRTA